MLGEAKVLREIMKLQKQGLDIMQLLQFLQTRLPPHLSFEYAIVIDARGQPLPLPLPTITSKKVRKGPLIYFRSCIDPDC